MGMFDSLLQNILYVEFAIHGITYRENAALDKVHAHHKTNQSKILQQRPRQLAYCLN